MSFRVWFSETETLVNGDWQDLGTADTSGDNAGEQAVRELGTTAGLYRVQPDGQPDQGFAYYFMDPEGSIERRNP